jgi:hypothetical protein
MDNVLTIIFLVLLLVIGFIEIIMNNKRLLTKYEFSIEFIEKLNDYVRSNGANYDAYSWLINKSIKMQNLIGQTGILRFKPPFACVFRP